MNILKSLQIFALAAILGGLAWGQADGGKKSPSAGHDIGSGAGDVAKGPVKGAGSVAQGTAKGVGNLVTLHPVNAAASVGKGAGGAGKDVAVGSVKGTGKMVRGVGKVFKKIL